MSWIRGIGTTQSTLLQYAKSRMGYCSKGGVKMVDLVCSALAKDGRKRPSGTSAKMWITQNIAHIKVESTKFKAANPTRKERKRLGEATAHVVHTQKPVGLTYEEANSDGFLSSYAWRALRWKVIQHYGPRCMCCGASPETGAVMNVDHIKPRRKRPDLALDFDNLQVLCEDCNHGKGNEEADYRPAEVDPTVRAMLRDIARYG